MYAGWEERALILCKESKGGGGRRDWLACGQITLAFKIQRGLCCSVFVDEPQSSECKPGPGEARAQLDRYPHAFWHKAKHKPQSKPLFTTYSGCSVPHLVKVSSIHLQGARGTQICGSNRISI